MNIESSLYTLIDYVDAIFQRAIAFPFTTVIHWCLTNVFILNTYSLNSFGCSLVDDIFCIAAAAIWIAADAVVLDWNC